MPVTLEMPYTHGNIDIVQITDSHLGEQPGDELLSMNADAGLDDVLSLINDQHAEFDLLLATGDIANFPSLPAYQRFVNTVNRSITAPMCWIPGNHDDPQLMQKALGEPYHQVISIGPWQLIMLNSRVPRQTYGHLDDSELAFLHDALSKSTDKHTMICLHHQPVPIGSAWMDNYIVDNAQEFWSAIKPFDHVKAVVWGHVHQAFDEQYRGIRLLSTPSTCVQFTPNQDEFGVDRAMPGYRLLSLSESGHIETTVHRVPVKDYGIDFESTGY